MDHDCAIEMENDSLTNWRSTNYSSYYAEMHIINLNLSLSLNFKFKPKTTYPETT